MPHSRARAHSPESLDEVEVGEFVAVHKGLQDQQVDGVPGEGAEGRVGCTGELSGTHLLEGVGWGRERRTQASCSWIRPLSGLRASV